MSKPAHISAAHTLDFVGYEERPGRAYLVQVSGRDGQPILDLDKQNFTILQARPGHPLVRRKASSVTTVLYQSEKIGVYAAEFYGTFTDDPVVIIVGRARRDLGWFGFGSAFGGRAVVDSAMAVVASRTWDKKELPDDLVGGY